MPELGGKVGALRHTLELGGAQLSVELYSHFAGLVVSSPESTVHVRLDSDDIARLVEWLERAIDIIEEGWEHDAGA